MSISVVILLIYLRTCCIVVENEVKVGVQLSLLITDEEPVSIDTLKIDKLCFEAIYSANFKIERQPLSSAACGLRYSSATEDIKDPVTRRFYPREQRQDAEIKDEHSGKNEPSTTKQRVIFSSDTGNYVLECKTEYHRQNILLTIAVDQLVLLQEVPIA